MGDDKTSSDPAPNNQHQQHSNILRTASFGSMPAIAGAGNTAKARSLDNIRIDPGWPEDATTSQAASETNTATPMALSEKRTRWRSSVDMHSVDTTNTTGTNNLGDGEDGGYLSSVGNSLAMIAEEAEQPHLAQVFAAAASVQTDGMGDGERGHHHNFPQAARRVFIAETGFFFGTYAAERRMSTVGSEDMPMRRTSSNVPPMRRTSSNVPPMRRTSSNIPSTAADKDKEHDLAAGVPEEKLQAFNSILITPRPSNGGLFSSVKWRVDKFMHEVVYQDVYPQHLTTPAGIFNHYLSIRMPPKYLVGKYHAFALSVAAVISGEFSGWNVGLGDAGYAGYWISNIMAAMMYLGLALCLAEMSTAIPVVGGAFAYSRAVVGDSMGFLVANSENLEYCMFVSLILITWADVINGLADGAIPHNWYPLLWAVILGIFMYTVNYHNKFTWWAMGVLTAVCFLQIIGLSIIGMTQFSTTHLSEGWAEEAQHKIDSKGGDYYWFGGFGGILNALHSSAWWFTGLECASLATKEVKSVRKAVPLALIASWACLGLSGVLFTLFAVLVPPGAGANAQASYPAVSLLQAMWGDAGAKVGYVMQIPSLTANLLAMLWCASRQTWALSRAGYLPSYLSITSTANGVPHRSVYFVGFYSYVMVLFVQNLEVLHGDLPATQVLLGLTVIAGVVTYFGIAVVYIAFWFLYPQAPRPFRNPLGLFSPIAVMVVSVCVIIAKVGISTVFQLTVAGYVVKMGISGAYYVIHGRLHLKPTEDALLAPFWKMREARISAGKKKKATSPA
ncbi:hypothetical protein HK104_008786 [Borealophlyctis nickersoniae]|nr:hypothetical protein HK104_008786 [Borealophlyctis nickersoniae]